MRLAIAVLLLVASGAEAQQIACGETYVIRRGDTLQRLANRAYGRGASFQPIWLANRERFGWRSPSLIEVGDAVYIPCLDPSGAPIPAAPIEPAQSAAIPAAPAAEAPPAAAAASIDGATEPFPLREAEAPVAAPTAADATSAALAEPEPAAPTNLVPTPEAARETSAVAEASPEAPIGSETAAQALAGPIADALLLGAPVEAHDPTDDLDLRDAAPSPAEVAAAVKSAVASPVAAPAPGTTPAPLALRLVQAPLSADGGAQTSGQVAALVKRALDLSGVAVTSETGPADAQSPFDLGDFDLSFPWVRPDCDAPALSPALARDCAALLWSAPIAEFLTVYVTPAAAPPPADPAALAGLRLCAAPAAPDAALAARGFELGTVDRAGSANACLERVLAGEADVAALEAETAAAVLADPRFAGRLVERYDLTQVGTLHAVARRDTPGAAAALVALDEGLAALSATGERFAILSAALAR